VRSRGAFRAALVHDVDSSRSRSTDSALAEIGRRFEAHLTALRVTKRRRPPVFHLRSDRAMKRFSLRNSRRPMMLGPDLLHRDAEVLSAHCATRASAPCGRGSLDLCAGEYPLSIRGRRSQVVRPDLSTRSNPPGCGRSRAPLRLLARQLLIHGQIARRHLNPSASKHRSGSGSASRACL